MLIRSLRGENFMKFQSLQIDGIPDRGLIGIQGFNEGGKSTIGELIQFALFGKTITTRDGSVMDLIHWEHDHCMVELDFTAVSPHVGPPALGGATVVGPVETYRIWREVDRYGTNFARLVRLDDRHEIASGCMQVQEELRRLMRYDFADFERSFYLAEKDFPRSPEQMREFLDRIVGVDTLMTVEADVREDVLEREEEFGRLQAEIQRNRLQIEKYVPNVARIPEVEKLRVEYDKNLAEQREAGKSLAKEIDSLDSLIKEREAVRERLRSLKSRPGNKLAGALDNLRRAYPAGGPPAGLDASKKELDHIRSRLDSLEKTTAAFAKLRDVVNGAGERLRQQLEGSDDHCLPAREQRLSRERDAARASRGRSKNLALVLLLIGLLLILFAGTELFPDAAPFLGGPHVATAWEEAQRTTLFGSLLGVGALGLIFCIVCAVKASGHRTRSEEKDAELRGLASEKTTVGEDRDALAQFAPDSAHLEEVAELLRGSRIREVTEAVKHFEGECSAVFGESGGLAAFSGSLADEEHKVIQRLRAHVKELKKSQQQGAERLKQEQSKRDRAESEIREYQKQDGRRATLEEQNSELEDQAAAVQKELETRQLLIQLLRETTESVRHRAGPNLGKTMRKLLPYITGGRYHDLQVTADFQLRIFTSEKSDFLGAQELSGGTFEGLSLGFRLAYTQAFIKAVTGSAQFLFLDEPFKAMDRERIHQTLSVLTRLSPELAQVFVVLPSLDPQDRPLFDAVVETTVGDGNLICSLGPSHTTRDITIADGPVTPADGGPVDSPSDGAPAATAAPRVVPPPVAPTSSEASAPEPPAVESPSPPVEPPQRLSGAVDPGPPSPESSVASPGAEGEPKPGEHVIYPNGFEGREFDRDSWLEFVARREERRDKEEKESPGTPGTDS